MIEFRHIMYRHRGAPHTVFEDFSFSIGKGEFACVAGPTGSGKSTLLRMLTGELRPDSGDIIVGGVVVNRLSNRQRAKYRRSIGCVLSDIPLLEEMTAAENIRLSLELHHKYKPAEEGQRIAAALAMCGLNGQDDSFPRSLSVGERERLMIARALVRQPLILLTDNTASQMDERSAQEFYHLLTEEHIRGMTILAMFNDTASFRYVPRSAKRYVLGKHGVEDFLPESNGAIAA